MKNLMHDLFISIQLVRIFSSVPQQGEENLEKSVITLKYAMDAERISNETSLTKIVSDTLESSWCILIILKYGPCINIAIQYDIPDDML